MKILKIDQIWHFMVKNDFYTRLVLTYLLCLMCGLYHKYIDFYVCTKSNLNNTSIKESKTKVKRALRPPLQAKRKCGFCHKTLDFTFCERSGSARASHCPPWWALTWASAGQSRSGSDCSAARCTAWRRAPPWRRVSRLFGSLASTAWPEI